MDALKFRLVQYDALFGDAPIYNFSMQELIMQGMQQKWENYFYRCKKNTWQVEFYYIVQPVKYLIIVINQFKYINNNLTNDRSSISMALPAVLGLHKFSRNLPKIITDHQCILAIVLPQSPVAKKNILLQRQHKYGAWNDWHQKSSLLLTCWFINWLRNGFGTRAGAWKF